MAKWIDVEANVTIRFSVLVSDEDGLKTAIANHVLDSVEDMTLCRIISASGIKDSIPTKEAKGYLCGFCRHYLGQTESSVPTVCPNCHNNTDELSAIKEA